MRCSGTFLGAISAGLIGALCGCSNQNQIRAVALSHPIEGWQFQGPFRDTNQIQADPGVIVVATSPERDLWRQVSCEMVNDLHRAATQALTSVTTLRSVFVFYSTDTHQSRQVVAEISRFRDFR